MACSIARTVDVIGERWTLLILRDLFAGVGRFEDLRRDLGVAPNILTDRLQRLEEHGIVSRRRYQDRPVRLEYHLTGKGRDLFPVLAAIVAWGDRWAGQQTGPPALLIHEPCGRPADARSVCSECGAELNADTVRIALGPGGQPGPGTALLGRFLSEFESHPHAETSASSPPNGALTRPPVR
ncbi:helix-turn-helix domain-containing protein [Nocardia sp. CC227C]|uniref:winged helix-turn-helix transcriptional regulator n=1 Tax=Nocardia sp. CC227C TaxID=3044562 RepID=UPI00278C08D2|nr:helix-turn-helix domain-containing protein [Nocardia sp. CC227C]